MYIIQFVDEHGVTSEWLDQSIVPVSGDIVRIEDCFYRVIGRIFDNGTNRIILPILHDKSIKLRGETDETNWCS